MRSAEWPLSSYGSPITSVLRSAAMTSLVTTLSPLIVMMRSIWVNRSWGWSTASSDPSGNCSTKTIDKVAYTAQ